MKLPAFEPLQFTRLAESEMRARARAFYEEMDRRRTTRHFSSEPVPRELIELAVLTAGTAPSGAHRQPWTFVAVSDPELKAQMRAAAEKEEHANYNGRMSPEWLEALAPLGTDEHKAHITEAPWVIVVFKQAYEMLEGGRRGKHYYVDESVGIACGMLIAALHHMGLVTLTHTPSPMAFLAELLGRPENERAYLLMPVGYPAPGAEVPKLARKPLEAILRWEGR
jgi:nitroreductase